MLDMPKMRILGYIHVPVVLLSRNLAEIFIKTIEAQKDLKFVDSLVPKTSRGKCALVGHT